MISRRRMVFQLTALLDLLLVVLFAQYMETQEASNRAIAAESSRRAKEQVLRAQAEKLTEQAQAERGQTDKLKEAALAKLSDLTSQVERLTADKQRLAAALAKAQEKIGTEQAGRADVEHRAAEQMAEVGEIFRQRLNVDPKVFQAYLTSASPGERENLLKEMQSLRSGSSASIVQYLRATAEFKKMCNVWEVHIFDDNSVRIRLDGQQRAGKFYVASASEFANRLIDAARENGEPRSLVVVLLTWSDADRRTREAVTAGIQDAITQLKPAWGNTKRIELSKLGYSPEAP